ncbi:MAG: aldo/keto reductase [Rubrobacter sp.]|nr:aldo/keto reductase [Rubrobacter sp.]
MDTRRIGDLEVTIVGIGCNNFGRRLDKAGADAVVHAALEAGINLFDTADVYGDGASEEYLGNTLGSRRDEVVIATKFGVQLGDDPGRGGASPRWIERAVEGSIRRLGTDRIDLYQLHKPDENTPVEDTLEALDRLVTAGKVRQIGCSNHSAAQIETALSISRERGLARYVSVQNEYSVLQREPEKGVTEACQKNGLALVPYFPLASGMLTGKYIRGEEAPAGSRLAGMSPSRSDRFANARNFARVEQLAALAKERGHTILELAISWLVAQPVVASVIAGATSPEQVRANVDASRWKLLPEDLSEVDKITGNLAV